MSRILKTFTSPNIKSWARITWIPFNSRIGITSSTTLTSKKSESFTHLRSYQAWTLWCPHCSNKNTSNSSKGNPYPSSSLCDCNVCYSPIQCKEKSRMFNASWSATNSRPSIVTASSTRNRTMKIISISSPPRTKKTIPNCQPSSEKAYKLINSTSRSRLSGSLLVRTKHSHTTRSIITLTSP